MYWLTDSTYSKVTLPALYVGGAFHFSSTLVHSLAVAFWATCNCENAHVHPLKPNLKQIFILNQSSVITI